MSCKCPMPVAAFATVTQQVSNPENTSKSPNQKRQCRDLTAPWGVRTGVPVVRGGCTYSRSTGSDWSVCRCGSWPMWRAPRVLRRPSPSAFNRESTPAQVLPSSLRFGGGGSPALERELWDNLPDTRVTRNSADYKQRGSVLPGCPTTKDVGRTSSPIPLPLEKCA
jgi:hypothetical protein